MHRVKIYYFMKIKIKQNENGKEESIVFLMTCNQNEICFMNKMDFVYFYVEYEL